MKITSTSGRRLPLHWRVVLIVFIAIVFYLCVWRDPIFRLTLDLNENPMWLTGFFGAYPLPETATAEEIVKQALHSFGFVNGKVRTYQIARVRWTLIAGTIYSAALVETDLGEKIVLYRYNTQPTLAPSHWWVKVYDALK